MIYPTLYATVRGQAILKGHKDLKALADSIDMPYQALLYRLKTAGAKWTEDEVKAILEAIGVDVRDIGVEVD